jgi:lysophospholipase L1-like esterase
MRRLALAAFLFIAVCTACAALPERTERGARVILLGDSVMAWNRDIGSSIADVIEKLLGQPVLDASVGGARMRLDGVGGAIGFSIPGQYKAGDWDAVVLNGGANDLLSTCGCDRCNAVIDRLVTEDFPALLNRLGDTPVYIVGYYGPAGDRPGNFDACDDELQVLERRLTRLAATLPNVEVVSVRDAFTGNPSLYDTDRIHPSPAGSERIGTLVARALTR